MVSGKVRKAIGAIIVQRASPARVILLKKLNADSLASEKPESSWDIPKRAVREGESDEQTLWRALEDELGSIDFKLVRKLPYKLNFAAPPGSRWERQETTLFFLEYEGAIDKFNPKTEEIEEVRLVKIDEAKLLSKHESTIKAIDDAIKLDVF
jgi:putative (di)nucleoside polyphosphate hydrolase